MQIFTWHDVENKLRRQREHWPESWNRVDVYNDEVVINVDAAKDVRENDEKILKDIFQKNYNNNEILIEFDQRKMRVTFEEGDDDDKEVIIKSPLFKDLYYSNNEFGKNKLPVPIQVFHSYKGGTGRTLSLISLTKELAEVYADQKKILVIDADIEAPGLTWLLDNNSENFPISYLDVLSLMHFNIMDRELAEKIAKVIKKSRFIIETEQYEVEQYFLPVYREKKQMMDIFSTPEKIIATQNNKYIITEFISQIGIELGVDLILIDLRAGITEFSAPFLFDPRVQRNLVTSTSLQSISGIQSIIDEIYEKVPDALLNTRVLLTMIPNEMEENTIRSIEDLLADKIEKEYERKLNKDQDSESTFLREGYIIRIPFESPFVHLGNFQEICSLLKGRILSDAMHKIAEDMFETVETKTLPLEEIRDTLEKLHNLANQEVTAEGNTSSKMLSTGPIREIIRDYGNTIPQIVILGAKGSGKTYVYKQMLTNKNWQGFLNNGVENTEIDMNQALILPLISTVNFKNVMSLSQECIQNVNEQLGDSKITFNAVNSNYNEIQSRCEENLTHTEWVDIWRRLIINMLGIPLSSFEEMDEYLECHGKKIIFLVDGLEDLFMESQTQKKENWKLAIRALCQNIVNELRYLQNNNIGIVVFVRKDMAEEAISVNYEQFKNQYSRYELKWTSTEALRLALWIAAQANSVFEKGIDILKASREALEKQLELLWGKKLGRNDSREAVSARWIIAALSDFTGQLQARDIVRFLKFASTNLPEGKLSYPDRYLMPSEIRKAIPECSREKYNEIKTEMKATYHILKKFEDMDEANKMLPLTLDEIVLTGDEIARLENQGYLTSSEKKYYFPEIIRFALGFRYQKGARPKVLSLLAR